MQPRKSASRRSLALWGAALLAACQAGPEAPAPQPAEPAPGGIRISHQRERDLTGDGAPERLRVLATGERFDSLNVRLAIEGADGTPRYVARWNSRDYFKYVPYHGVADSLIERRVRGHLAELLADTAFAPRRVQRPGDRTRTVDTAAVHYDVAEHDWRRRNGVADTAILPQRAYSEVFDAVSGGATGLRPRTGALADELDGKPSFTYYAGGEETYTVAWSEREKRFVRVHSCC